MSQGRRPWLDYTMLYKILKGRTNYADYVQRRDRIEQGELVSDPRYSPTNDGFLMHNIKEGAAHTTPDDVNRFLNRNGPTLASVPSVTVPSPPTVTSESKNRSIWLNITPGADGGSPLTKYEYRYKISTDTTFTSFESFVPTDRLINPFIIPGLTNGIEYDIQVRSVNSVGSSEPSVTVSNTPIGPPSAPLDFSIGIITTTIPLYFNPPSNNGGSEIIGYEYSINSAEYITFIPIENTDPGTSLKYNLPIGELELGRFYGIVIRAFNEKFRGSNSGGLTFILPTVPLAPTISRVDPGDTTASIVFTQNGIGQRAGNGGSEITNYAYSIDSGESFQPFSPPQTQSPVTIPNLTNGVDYLVALKAINVKGTSTDTSLIFGVKPYGVPSAPVITNVEGINGAAIVTFTQNSDGGALITEYKVFYNVSDSTYVQYSAPVTVSKISDTSIRINGLQNGTDYSIAIKVANSRGDSPISNLVSVRPATVPSAPSITSITAGNGNATVVFTPPQSNGGRSILGYKYSKNGKNGPFIELSTESINNTFIIPDLPGPVNYTISILAYNIRGDGIPSEINTVEIPETQEPPSKPVVLGAGASNSSALISFTQPVYVGSPITQYICVCTYTFNGVQMTENITVSYSPVYGSDPESFFIPGLINGVTYSIKLKAVNSGGQSEISDAAANVMPIGPPSQPVITNVTADNVTRKVTLTVRQDTNGGAPITNYLYFMNDGGPQEFNPAVSPTTQTVTLEIIVPSYGTYTFRLQAYSNLGYSLESNTSSSITLEEPPVAPEAPYDISVSLEPTATYDNGKVTIRFLQGFNGRSEITEYQCLVSPDGEEPILITKPLIPSYETYNEIIIDNLTVGMPYTFQLKAVNAVGPSENYSNPVSIVPKSKPSKPIITEENIIAGDGFITITFTQTSLGGSSSVNYNFYFNGENRQPDTPVSSTAPETRTVTFSGLSNGVSYNVRMEAVNEIGTSDLSDELTSVIPTAPPPTPEPVAPLAPTITNVDTANSKMIVTFTQGQNDAIIVNYLYSFAEEGDNNFSPLPTPFGPSYTGSNTIEIPGLTDGQSYYIRLIAVGADDLISNPSGRQGPIRIVGLPTAPIINTPITAADASAIIAFTPGSTGGDSNENITYKCFYSLSSTAADNDYLEFTAPFSYSLTETNTFTVTGLTNGTTYYIKLKATNSKGSSGLSTQYVPVKPLTAPSPPVITNFVADDATATVTFTLASDGGDSNITYIVSYNTDNSETYTTFLPPVEMTITPHTLTEQMTVSFTGLTNGTTYYIVLRAKNGANLTSGYSNKATVRPTKQEGKLKWATKLQTSNTTNNTNTFSAPQITKDAFGNIFVAGSFTTNDFIIDNWVNTNPTNKTITTNQFGKFAHSGSTDCYIVKYNSEGSALMAIRIGGSGARFLRSITTDSAGDFYVVHTGISGTVLYNWSNQKDGNGNFIFDNSNSYGKLPSTVTNAINIVKYNGSTGQIVWTVNINTIFPGGMGVPKITVDNLDNLYFNYSTGGPSFQSSFTINKSNGVDASGNIIFETVKTVNLFSFINGLLKFNRNTGDFIWSNYFTRTASTHSINSITTDPQNNIYVSGNFFGTIIFYTENGTDASGNMVFVENGKFSSSNHDGFIIKYDGTGSVLWVATMTGSSVDNYYTIRSDSDGNIFVIGNYTSTSQIVINNGSSNKDGSGTYTFNQFGSIPITNTSTDAIIVKYNGTTGVVMWVTKLDSLQGETGLSIGIDNSGNVYAGGPYLVTNSGSPNTLTIRNGTSTGGVLTFGTFGSLTESIEQNAVFLAKFKGSNGEAVWVTNIKGGSTPMPIGDIEVDSSNNIYLTIQHIQNLTLVPLKFYDWDGKGATNINTLLLSGSLDKTSGYNAFIAKYKG